MKPINPIHAKGLLWLVIALVILIPGTASALKSDKDKPISIEADSVDIDDRNGVAIYKGRVELSQGTIKMKADSVTVTSREGQTDHIRARGNPVHFEQQPDGEKGLIKARANTIEYDSNGEITYLIGNAVLNQGKDSFKSDRIIYDRTKAVVKGGASAKGKQRVKVTIQSQKNKDK